MSQKDDRRCIVIGDVHGCIDELKELLLECNYSGPDKDRLVFVGDLVDKGPASREVIEFAQICHAEVALGNHDEKHLRWNRWERKVVAGEADKNPMKHNGYYWDMNEYEWNFFSEMPLWVELNPYWIVVHAGLECNGKTLEEMDKKVMIRIRDVHPVTGNYYQTTDPRIRAEGAVRWAEKWDKPLNVIYGHAPGYTVKIDRNDHGNVCLGIDTGCVHGGYLTATIIEPHGQLFEFKQVRAAKKYAEPFLDTEDYIENARRERETSFSC